MPTLDLETVLYPWGSRLNSDSGSTESRFGSKVLDVNQRLGFENEGLKFIFYGNDLISYLLTTELHLAELLGPICYLNSGLNQVI